MPWIESDTRIWDHWKTKLLAEELKIDIVQAVGHLHSLWHFTLENAWRDGNLEKWKERGVAEAARWRKDPGDFMAAMQKAELMDGFAIHDWLDRAGLLVRERLRKEAVRKGKGKTSSDGSEYGH
jgi:hypothetical protein